nr:MAG TPA: hypothetical protein [Caudoviricetes sp.]
MFFIILFITELLTGSICFSVLSLAYLKKAGNFPFV